MSAAILTAAIALDAVVGDPDWLWRRAPHPVVWIGRAIGLADRHLNREDDAPVRRRAMGLATVIALVAGSLAVGAALHALFDALNAFGRFGTVLEVVAVAVLLAGRSLREHVARVADGLRTGLAEGRREVSMIVGRDAERLDASGVSRAAVESLAENFADGVVAPALWYFLLGLPGIIAYKAINTADSMIGHRSPRHLDFGRAAARLDDAVNWPAARLTAGLIALARWRRVWPSRGTILTDAAGHRSPNAGWPESAMAVALGLALGGPRSYGEGVLDEPWLNEGGARGAGPDDIARALVVYRDAGVIGAGVVLIFAFA